MATIGDVLSQASRQQLATVANRTAVRTYERERKRRWRAYRRQAGVAPNGRTIRPVPVPVDPQAGYSVLKVVG